MNAVTTKYNYLLPRIDATLDVLTGAQWFVTLDLKLGYHQVAMAEEDLKLNMKKCCLFRKKVSFLGLRKLRQSVNGRLPREWTVIEVCGFLEIASYYRRFMAGFAQITISLHHFTRKRAQFNWSEEVKPLIS